MPHTQEIPVSTDLACHAKAIELAKHALRMTTASGSGHPSTAQAISHIVVELMYRQMRYDPSDPWNKASDRLVLSLGHAVPIVYAAYADLGGAVGKDPAKMRTLTVDDLDSLRELSSVLDGHPNPAEGFPFFDAATGSLGQGLSVAAGLALAARLDGIDKRIFTIIGDGESREGQVWEAADFIVDHGLTNVCAIFSCNGHGQAASVSPQQSGEAIGAKMHAFGWEVAEVDGHSPSALADVFRRVGSTIKPLAVVATTVKGWGVESMIGHNFHGKPASKEQLDAMLDELDATGVALGAVAGLLPKPPMPGVAKGPKAGTKISLPAIEKAFERCGFGKALKKKELATRNAYGAALVALGDVDSRIVALDGDVSNSTFSNMFAAEHSDRFFECKIAEQNMISVGTGLAAGGKIPFASSFAKFIARAVDQIDMAGITRGNLKVVGSHSGVSLAADGPSQMSLSDVAYFRSMSRVDDGYGRTACHMFNPSDAVSAYRCCELMANIHGLCFMRTHRPAAPFLYKLDETFSVGGCKQLREGSVLTLVSSGYMLHTVLQAASQLEAEGVSCNVFDAYTFPLDASLILDAALGSGGRILTVEDNYIGGLQSELAEAAAEGGNLRVVGMTAGRIPKSALSAEEVFDYVGVGRRQIVDRAKAFVSS
jgi:transketolase